MNNLSKKTIKELMLLRQRKFRRRYKKFIIEGDKICREVLLSHMPPIAVYALPDWVATHRDLLKRYEGTLTVVSERELKKISSLTTTNKILAVLPLPNHSLKEETLQDGFSIFLDAIQDPGNFGTIIRTADWFGIRHIFYSKGTVDPYNPKVLQASMGSFLRVKLIEMEFTQLKDKYPTLPAIATLLDGKNLYKMKKPERGLIIIGNEGSGIDQSIIDRVDMKVTIPKAKESKAESLNAGVALGIIAGEMIRGNKGNC